MNKSATLVRIPSQHHHTLKAYNAADEMLVGAITSSKKNRIITFNDRFGYLQSQLSKNNAIEPVIHLASQAAALKANNKKDPNVVHEFGLSMAIEAAYETGLIHLPKSLPLFEAFVASCHEHLTDSGTLHVGFMTRHFTPKIVEIVSKYFEVISQSRSIKKARILTAKGKKQIDSNKINTAGIFAEGKLDLGTKFLIDSIAIAPLETEILDLCSGSGHIASWLSTQNSSCNVHLIEDFISSYLYASQRLEGPSFHHHWHYDTSLIKDNSLDLIVCNPPFHFEHEVDLAIPSSLLNGAAKKLKSSGRLLLVSNNHINYISMLTAYRYHTKIAENKKYYVLECQK